MSRSASNAKALPAGARFGKYELLDCIAESLMSRVYLARVSLGKLNRIVIVKTLNPSYLAHQQSRERFYQEIEFTAALNHPNIIQIYDFGEERGCPFIVMEWLRGRDLKEVLREKVAATGSGIVMLIACHLIEQTARGLAHAHGF